MKDSPDSIKMNLSQRNGSARPKNKKKSYSGRRVENAPIDHRLHCDEEEGVQPKFFILQDFWPAFKLFQVCGTFPLKEVIDEDGNIQLQPTTISKSVMILSIWLLALSLPWIGKLKRLDF